MVYSQILRRLREEKTNYRKRKHLLMGRRDYITVQISSENTLVQIHKPEMQGDKVLASAHSRYLLGKGWKGSRKTFQQLILQDILREKKLLTKE